MGLEGNIDIISISAVIQQWGWNDQLEAAKKVSRLHQIRFPGGGPPNWQRRGKAGDKQIPTTISVKTRSSVLHQDVRSCWCCYRHDWEDRGVG